MSSALRQVARSLAPRLTRSMASGAEHGHGHIKPGYYYDYEHGPHMMQLWALPNKKVKVAAWIIGVTGLGVGIPVFAVVYQQNKLKG